MAEATARRLVFAGEAIVDIVMRIPGLPEPGGDVLATESEVTVGGGFNVMAAAARQGMPVVYAGGHGTGPWGALVRAALDDEGISVLHPPDPTRDTGFDVALVEPDAERTFVTRLGAETLRPAGSHASVHARAGDIVYISGYGLVPEASGPAGGQWAAALPDGVLLFLDPGPLAAQIPAPTLTPVLDRCDWLSCNEREATALCGESDPVRAARLLRERTRRGQVIIRTGAAGCVMALRADPLPFRIPAPVVNAVDTTGAGDAHAGVFLAGLAEGHAPADAARRANVAAALSVTRHGPATAPARAELDRWITQYGQ